MMRSSRSVHSNERTSPTPSRSPATASRHWTTSSEPNPKQPDPRPDWSCSTSSPPGKIASWGPCSAASTSRRMQQSAAARRRGARTCAIAQIRACAPLARRDCFCSRPGAGRAIALATLRSPRSARRSSLSSSPKSRRAGQRQRGRRISSGPSVCTKSSETLALSGRSGRLDPRGSAQRVASRSAGMAGLLKGGEERSDTVRRRRTPALLRRGRGSTFGKLVEAGAEASRARALGSHRSWSRPRSSSVSSSMGCRS